MKQSIFSRLSLAWDIATNKRGINEVVEHFRRIESGAGKDGIAGDPYDVIVSVYRCVNFIAGAVVSMPFHVSTAEDRIIETGPVADLLDEPNEFQSGEDLFFDAIALALLGGRSHFYFPDSLGRRIAKIYAVGIRQMRPRMVDGGRRRDGWLYRPAGANWSQAIPVSDDEQWCMTLPAYDPDKPWEGQSPASVVMRQIRQVYKADVANESSLDNGVEPGGALKTPNNLTPEQKRDLRQFIEERHAGVGNRRRLMLLEGGLEFEAMQATFKDMEFTSLKVLSRSEICAAFGLDDSIVFRPEGAANSEYIDTKEQSSWLNVIILRAAWLASHIDRGILSRFEGDRSLTLHESLRDATRMPTPRQRSLRVTAKALRRRRLFAWFDWSKTEAARRIEKSTFDLAKTAVRELKCTVEEANDRFDLGLTPNDAQKRVWQTTNEFPFDPNAGEPGQDDPAGPPATDDDVTVTDDDERNTPEHVERELSEATLARLWQQWRASWQGLERAARSGAENIINQWRNETIANIETQLPTVEQTDAADSVVINLRHTPLVQLDGEWHEARESVAASFRIPAQTKDVIGQLLFSLVNDDGKNRLVAKLGQFVRQAHQLGGEQSLDEAAAAAGEDKPATFNMDSDVMAHVRKRETMISGASQRMQQRVRKVIAEGLANSKTPGEIAQDIRQQFRIESARARLIARQEIGSSVEAGRQAGRSQAGVPSKSWLWSRKETGRPWHSETEHQTMDNPIANDADFTVAQTGNKCKHPRATNDPQDDINCGCTTISRYPADQDKDIRLMRHLREKGFRSTTIERGDA